MTAAIQTLWAAQLARGLADAGIATCVVSPGSRSTPLVAALARESRLELPSIIDERAAAFFALGEARATGRPVAIVCTSGTAAAHYYPAIVEASLAGVPLVAITADRPPELHDCGASQTIDQTRLYGTFVRGAFELGAPVGDAFAFRALRAKLAQAIARARGPLPGPVHINVPLRKPLEPAAPTTELELELAKLVEIPLAVARPRLVADPAQLDALAAAIAAEPDGAIIAGAMPVAFGAAREAVMALAKRAGYPVIAEAGSQLRGADTVHHFDLIAMQAPPPRLIIQLGAEPVAASWPAWLAASSAERWVLAETWADPAASAQVVLGEVATSIRELVARVATDRHDFAARWQVLDRRAAAALALVLETQPTSETAVIRAALAAAGDATLQIGNSLPIRVVEHAAGAARTVITQRGAAGIDGLVASAAGATRAGKPVLLVLGDVSFAHDLGGLLVARRSRAPLAILVVDNGGGQIFAGLPVARAELGAAFATHFTTPPELDPVAVAQALGARAVLARSPSAAAAAVATALATPGVTVIHAPVSRSGAHDVRRAALESLATRGTP